ncbi:MAG: YbbR-like domain-containing protein [Rhodothermia bacterium]|nr:MAG: YbbR-like domain-containing protein [Rhodothermia bacterium]
MQETYTQFFDFPTEVQNLPDDQALTQVPPSTIRVYVEGEGIQLLRLYYNPPTIPIDASLSVIDLEVLAAEVASNVRSESVTPTSIVLQKELRTEKRFPIRSRLEINPAPGYQVVGPVSLVPDSVIVSGAVSVLDGLSFWNTVQLTQVHAKDSVRVTLSLADTLAGLVELSSFATEARAVVLQFTEGSREIEVRVKDGVHSTPVSFEPATTTVTYQIPIIQYDQALEATDFYAFVPFEEIRSDTTGNVYPLVNPPAGLIIRGISIFPDAFRYYHNLPGPN